MREVLTQLFGEEAVTDEVMKRFDSEIGKKFVAKSDYNSKLKEIENLKNEKKTIEDNLSNLNEEAKAGSTKYDELLNKYNQLIADNEKAKAEAKLKAYVAGQIKDNEWTSEYAKSGVIHDMQTELGKPENEGKTLEEIFKLVTDGKEGLIKNPNPANMAGLGDVQADELSDMDARAIMGLPPKK